MAIASPSLWLRRMPAHALNGLAVSVGIGLIDVMFDALAGARAAQLAVGSAICASLADRVATPARTWRMVLFAGGLGSVTSLAMLFLIPFRVELGTGIMLLVLAAQMALAWGPRARAISFAAILSIIFAMAQPVGQPIASAIGWNVLGVLIYLPWAYGTSALLQPRYRTLALAAAMHAAANLLRSRSARYEASAGHEAQGPGLENWIRDESALAERLQAARDLLFAAPATARDELQTAALLRTIEVRDTLLASRIDLDLLGSDETARHVRTGLARELRVLASRLDTAARAVRGLPDAGLPTLVPCTQSGLFGELALAANDPRARLLPALIVRVQRLRDEMQRIDALVRGTREEPALSRAELRHFISPEGWPLRALRPHASLGSPVLRHAARASLALGAAYYVALVLPWSSHPQWLVLSVAVVLQGSLEQTLARRNARVLGTTLGCLIALLFAGVHSTSVLGFAFICAVGVAHSFAVERYFVTAVAATVMALLQAELANAAVQSPVAERLADTVLGAMLAWAFSFVLPTWEARGLPTAIARTLEAMHEYARQTLRRDPDSAVAQRLARRRAYDELGALSAALQRSAVEPARVRPPVREIEVLIDHAHRLMAHLSIVRLTLARRAKELDHPEVTAQLQVAETALSTALAPDASALPTAAVPIGLENLPTDPPAENVLPWFERRLYWAMYDSQELARAARRALDLLQTQAFHLAG